VNVAEREQIGSVDLGFEENTTDEDARRSFIT
jgi:hypothetical protein